MPGMIVHTMFPSFHLFYQPNQLYFFIILIYSVPFFFYFHTHSYFVFALL